MKRFWPSCVACLFCLISAGGALAQTLTYHLHKEASSTGGLDQLKSAGPDATTFVLLSANLKSQANGEYLIEAFNTQASDPSMSGSIPTNSTVSFSLYMRDTATVGKMTPRAKLFLNSSSGTQFCTATGTTALTNTVTKISLSCKTSSAITIASTDRLYLWVGVNLTAGSTSPFNGELDVEGTLNGSTDSQVTAPAPAAVISSLTPNTGAVQASVTIAGQNFGLTPGTVTFSSNKGATIPSQDWTPTQILVPMVPTGAMTGSVTVTASGKAVTGLTFTVVPAPSISSLSPASGPIGTQVTISGSNFGTTAGTVKFSGIQAAATWGASSITATVPAGATTGNVVVHASGVDSNAKTFRVVQFWTTTGNLTAARSSAAATLLNNGKVLITGGYDQSSNGMNTAELYDPATGTFTATGNMNYARGGHTATLLSNGMVLVAGGIGSSFPPFATAELFDPATGTFTLVGNLDNARFLHTATLLPNGFVLIVGGQDGNSIPMASAELYDPNKQTFTTTGSLKTASDGHSATLMNNGKVLIAGGETWDPSVGYKVVSRAEVYDPSSGTFSSTGNLTSLRKNHTAALLNGGKVLIAGGTSTSSSSGTLASAELYDPAAGTFTVTGSMNDTRSQHTATLLNSGAVLVAGGFNANVGTLSSAELFDPVAGTFSYTNQFNNSRYAHTATLLNNGTVLATGGIQTNNSFASAELYPAASSAPAGLVSVAISPAASTVPEGTTQQFTATGTFSNNSTQLLGSVRWASSNNAIASITNDASNSGQAFGVAAGTTTVSACSGSICGSTTLTVQSAPPILRVLAPGAGTPGTSVEIFGANFGATQQTSNVTFNGIVATPSSWSPTSIVAPVPAGATTGNVVVTVSSASNPVNFIVGTLSSLAISPSNPSVSFGSTLQLAAIGTYSEGSTLNLTAFAGWSSSAPTIATVGSAGLVSGVYAGQSTIQASLGSVSGTATLNVTSILSMTGSLNTARYSHTATLLDSGKVLIAGGFGPLFPTNTELYDPSTGIFSTGAALHNPRYNHTATLLNNGLVLLTGGADQNRNALNTSELFDPSSGNLIPGASMNTARYNHTATLLPNGQVLIAGGQNQSGSIFASAELYNPATGTFTATGSLNAAREGHTATLLDSGLVLISAGFGANNSFPGNFEVYDYTTGAFTVTASSSLLGTGTSSALLNNGDVLIVDGTNAALYSSGLVRSGSSGGEGALTLLNNGTVLLTGGSAGSSLTNDAEFYDPVARTFTSLGGMNSTREAHTATKLANGSVLIAGGIDSGSNTLASAEIYQATNTAPAGLVSIAISPSTASFPAMTSQTLVATGTFSDHSTQTLASSDWSSSNNSVVTVSNDAGNYGQAFGLQAGSATVTACAGSICGSSSITVGNAAPAITGLNPSTGTVGTVVTITGSGFGPTQGSSTVTFNGAPAVPITWYPGSITVAVPFAASTGNVVVTVAGSASNGSLFTMPMLITSLSASTGVPGTWITISGSDFGSTTGVVTFHGQSATISSWSNNSIAVVVPNGASSGNVVVSNGGVQSNAVPFTVGPVVYSFERSITFDHTKIPNTDQMNFPVLISGQFGYLATVAHGGKVQNGSGYDIIFTSDVAGTSKLDHEIESYDPLTGRINFWVRIPVLSHNTDTVIYLQYGSPAVITSQENRTGVWDSSYQMVLHLDEAAAPYHDSTSNAYASTGGGTSYPAQGQGKIGQGQSYNGGVGQYIAFSQSQSPNPNAAITMEAWIQTTQNSATGQVQMFGKGNNATLSYEMLFSSGNTNTSAEALLNSSNSTVVTIAGTSTINDNNWHHIAVTAPTTGNVVLYTDGVANASLSNSAPLLMTTTDPLLLGASCQNCFAMTGTLDEVRISNSARSADWIATEYNNQNSPSTFALTGLENGPSISSLSPFSGEPGAAITILGNGFSGTAGTVSFNGVGATVTNWSNNSITAVVPVTSTTGPVVVTAGGVQTNGVSFTVLRPTINNLNPASGDPGTAVVIQGANFDSAQGTGQVTFNGLTASVASWSAGSITAYVPNGAGTGNVVVTAPNGATSNGTAFTVTDNFLITLLSPANGPVGSTVTIFGGGFGSTQGSSALAFNGTTATITSWSEDEIVATVPSGTSTGPVTVTLGGGSMAWSAVPFVLSTSVQVTDSLGNNSSYTSAMLGGAWQNIAATGSGCSSCTVRGNVQDSYDSSGNVLTHTDELGHVTTYTYDAAN
ncbi:MAG TPA: DUF2341 domain-containing protein, partial [Candidatus Angelobacter sp.]|nr:DUF2341 domain-containing protein [Candidatus Angelobacter sp.]